MAEARQIKIIKPQPGFQTQALSTPADIAILGAAAGVGKTFVLLLDPLRDMHVPGFGGVIFRRTTTQIRNEGGLWDTSVGLYRPIKAIPKESYLEWEFPKGQKIKFSHIEHEKNIYDWQGAQIPYIGFDELTHFTRKMFFYLLTRNRSTCGVRPYLRATCNPDPESWVAQFISWWIDQDTGYPIKDRIGKLRYLVVDGETDIWGDTVDEVIERAWHVIGPQVERSGIDPRSFVKSVTFISGSIYDNKELLTVDPGYLANLLSQDEATKAALLDGNWKVIASDRDIYNYHDFIGLFDNVRAPAASTRKCITADIAMKGSNKFVVGYWNGWELQNIEVIAKSDGRDVIDLLTAVAQHYGVNNRDIVYDADGVGSFVDGFIRNATPFNGGAPAMEVKDPVSGKPIKENYFNLKTQCYYRSGERVARGDIKVSNQVADKMYNDKTTVRQRMMFERQAIKRDKVDTDGKLRIISKEEMKAKLNGESPDVMDMFMMREMLELVQRKTVIFG